jgi:DNA-directed RNA polymerase specialized sigma24 family protein
VSSTSPPRTSNGATVEEAIGRLRKNNGADEDTANAVAYGTVFAVCRKHAREAVTDLDSYFWKSVKNNFCKQLGRNALAQCSSFDTLDARCDGLPSVSGDQLDAAIDLRARLCRLDEENRAIVLRDFEGDTSEQIGAARGLTAATVRKRHRARLQEDGPELTRAPAQYPGPRRRTQLFSRRCHRPRPARMCPGMTSPDTSLVAVNFHLYKPCNYRCRFCFATFRDLRGQLSLEHALTPAAPAPRGRLREAQLRRR